MNQISQRTAHLIGIPAVETLWRKRVIVFGIGGVGGHAIEALARTGVGNLGIVDGDCVDPTNLNRQIIALQSTINQKKTRVTTNRILDIDPSIVVSGFDYVLNKKTLSSFRLENWDYIVDAIDDVSAKILLAQEARRLDVPIISAMGVGYKRDPTRLRISTIDKTHTCPLARIMRKELGLLGIKDLTVVFSEEPPSRSLKDLEDQSPASSAFVPATAGLLMASRVVEDLIKTSQITCF